MKALRALFTLAIVLAAPSFAKFSADRYKTVDVRELQLNTEEYKNKRVTFQSQFVGVETSFPKHVVQSGFKQDRDICILTRLGTVLVMARKDDEITELLKTLKRGDTLVVYGKIREFKSPANREMVRAKYYLDLEHIEKGPEGAAAVGGEGEEKPLPDKPGVRSRRPLRK
jgi:hypothetical protein